MELTFTKAKETKGTWQFQETGFPVGARPVVGTLYLTKDALKAMGWPQELKVIINGTNGGQVS